VENVIRAGLGDQTFHEERPMTERRLKIPAAARRLKTVTEMAAPKGHPHNVEFAVDDASGKERIFKTWDEACGFAVGLAASGRTVHLDVLCHDEAGAKAMGLEDQYKEDPDASVTTRLEIKANDQGRVA